MNEEKVRREATARMVRGLVCFTGLEHTESSTFTGVLFYHSFESSCYGGTKVACIFWVDTASVEVECPRAVVEDILGDCALKGCAE